MNVCSVCKFPPGRYINNKTGERKITIFLKGPKGTYVCTNCVDEGRGIPVAKMTKKERKEMKKRIRGY